MGRKDLKKSPRLPSPLRAGYAIGGGLTDTGWKSPRCSPADSDEPRLSSSALGLTGCHVRTDSAQLPPFPLFKKKWRKR